MSTELTREQIEHLRSSLPSALSSVLCDMALAHLKEAAELRAVDETLARRPALDCFPLRSEKIERCIKTAERVDEVLAASEPFTSRELALEILAWLRRDIPQTVVSALKLILKNYVNTGVYDDKINELCGHVVEPPLLVQRVMQENAELRETLERYKQRQHRMTETLSDSCCALVSCRQALTELVKLKRLKDTFPELLAQTDEHGYSMAYQRAAFDYGSRKPLAWDAAFKLVPPED